MGGIIVPVKKFGSLKPKDDKKASIDIKKITEETFSEDTAMDTPPPQYVFPAEGTEYIPKSERLLAIFDMLTDKSFPRKGPGKSTKIKILDAIIVAAIDKKIILQETEDANN